jgi:hypothetical protein
MLAIVGKMSPWAVRFEPYWLKAEEGSVIFCFWEFLEQRAGGE